MRVLIACLAMFFLLGSVSHAADIVFVKQNSEPKYLPDQSGLCDQIYAELSKRLSEQGITTTVDEAFYPVKRILAMLEAGQGHAFCGAGMTDERKTLYVYSKIPVYHVSNVILAHKEETVIPTTFAEIAEKQLVIGSFYGTSSSAWLMHQPGVQVSNNHVSLDNVVKLISDQKGLRYFFYHDLGLNYYVRTRGLPLQVLPTRYRTIPQNMLYSRALPEALRNAVEDALQDMQDEGVMTHIQQQYLTNE
ncbi:ABC transporter substrate-binding protein [Reinekea sp. G2M2-21]|uniref:substrate-binding periplasmic protein n=1 Tax=Reinekea sp. G2M2-21 TaxID=2788942 RepID=UPI0018A9BFD0|nr:transporter substrate-binding domain-containing protein [Reinekea sp. G2M2-21]